MTPVTDKQGNTVAYLYNNIVLDTTLQKVLGVILGNCIFGGKSSPLGKFFNNVFRSRNGKVVAQVQNIQRPEPAINKLKIQEGAWKIIDRVKEHVCGIIPEVEEWSDTSLPEFLQAS